MERPKEDIGVFNLNFMRESVQMRISRLPEDKRNMVGLVETMQPLEYILTGDKLEAFKELKENIIKAGEEESAEEAVETVASLIQSYLKDNFTLAEAEQIINAMRDDVPEDKDLVLNDAFFVTVEDNTVSLHVMAMASLSNQEKMTLFREAFKNLAENIKNNEKYSDVEKIRAKSWIVSENPGLIKRLGFEIDDSDESLAHIEADKFVEIVTEKFN